MIVLDANVLLYAYDRTSSKHRAARRWVEDVLSSPAPVGLPWLAVYAFLRIVTNQNLPGQRYSMKEAIEVVESWLEQPNVRLLGPGDRHWDHFKDALLSGQVRGRTVTDAAFAALTTEHGGILHSCDRGFGRFPHLRWRDPVA